MTKYNIRVGRPHCVVLTDSPHWGWSRTLAVALTRARRLSKHIRSDCRVAVECDGVILAHTSDAGACYTGMARPLEMLI